MTLQPIPSVFPFTRIWGKFLFLFYQCSVIAKNYRLASSLLFQLVATGDRHLPGQWADNDGASLQCRNLLRSPKWGERTCLQIILLLKCYRQTPIFRHPFFQKTVFFSKIFFGKPPSKFLEVCLNSEYMWKCPVYNFNSAKALKKLISAGVEVTSTLPNSDTQKDLPM